MGLIANDRNRTQGSEYAINDSTNLLDLGTPLKMVARVVLYSYELLEQTPLEERNILFKGTPHSLIAKKILQKCCQVLNTICYLR